MDKTDYKTKCDKLKIKTDLLKTLLNIKFNNGINNSIIKGGGRYKCEPINDFKDICKEDDKNGKYKTHESCVNDCEIKYINTQLIKNNLKGETMKFHLFIKEMREDEKIDIFLKGGNVLGIEILKIMFHTNTFDKNFDDFLKLNLIKDWDFMGLTDSLITPEYHDKLIEIGKKHKLYNRASAFILFQTKIPLETYKKPLYEISILDNDGYSKLEIPLTTMKIKITEHNIKYIYMLSKLFIDYEKGMEVDKNALKRILSKINVQIYPCKDGFYNITNNFDDGNLSNELLKFIKSYEKYHHDLPQFFVTHVQDLYRMCFRLVEKNIPKNDNIKTFLKNKLTYQKHINWLFDSEWLIKMLKLFTTELGKKTFKIFSSEKLPLDGLTKLSEFFVNVSIKRVVTEWTTIPLLGRELFNNIFGFTYDSIKDIIKTLDKTNSLVKIFLIYYNKLNNIDDKKDSSDSPKDSD
jgi:hypothetical protein